MSDKVLSAAGTVVRKCKAPARTIQQLGSARCSAQCKHWNIKEKRCEFQEGLMRIRMRECSRFMNEHPDIETELRCPECRAYMGQRKVCDVRKDKAHYMCPKCGRTFTAISLVFVE